MENFETVSTLLAFVHFKQNYVILAKSKLTFHLVVFIQSFILTLSYLVGNQL